MPKKTKLKSKCCKSYRDKGKACKRCPLVACASETKLLELAAKIRKEEKRRKFCDRVGIEHAAVA